MGPDQQFNLWRPNATDSLSVDSRRVHQGKLLEHIFFESSHAEILQAGGVCVVPIDYQLSDNELIIC